MQISPFLWELAYRLARCYLLLKTRVVLRCHGEVPAGPVLLCAKHVSSLDIPVLAYVCRSLRGDRPYFQMGSFIGYRVLGAMRPLLRRIGGFPVMRPKETRRLMDAEGMDRRTALGRMRQVNEEAERSRIRVLRGGGCLVVFPEGTRSEGELLPLKSRLEIGTALAVAAGGGGPPPQIWPAVLSLGRKRFFRRPLVVDLLRPFPAAGSVDSVIERLEREFRSHWVPSGTPQAREPA